MGDKGAQDEDSGKYWFGLKKHFKVPCAYSCPEETLPSMKISRIMSVCAIIQLYRKWYPMFPETGFLYPRIITKLTARKAQEISFVTREGQN